MLEFVHAKDDGATPLHFAAIQNQLEVTDLRIAQGADLNAKDDEFGATPAGWANEKGHEAMVHRLVAAGVYIDLPRAAAFGLINRVRELLEEDPFSVNVSSGWGTPLHEASLWGRREMVELLLANGGNPNLKNRDGRTALAIASHQIASNGQDTPLAVELRNQEILANCAQIVEMLKRHDAQSH